MIRRYLPAILRSCRWVSNHWHAVIRTRPDLVEKLSDDEVVKRWMRVFPKRREGTPEQIKKSMENEVRQVLKSKQRVDELRSRLSSVSWFPRSAGPPDVYCLMAV